MGIKQKLAMGILTGGLAISMIGGGTYAYFNDVAVSENNTFAAGTLDLAVNPETFIKVDNLKPGDWMNRTFKLENKGTLDISKVFLTTEYTESVAGFGDHIVVEFLRNEDKGSILGDSNVIASKTLNELRALSLDAVDNTSPRGWLGWQGGEQDGLLAGTKDNMYVKFRFKDNGADQNAYQKANLSLTWKFNAQQTAGSAK
ncbi:SipW-dependent-type signal peptide-containing protein [Psychrobacillus sp. INOP01]|uniref:TasA family protein n=1 Tax=Psychrobacillus sp. INOP01 TaxID=2829187 RepID=UPI001BA81982|nr:TasA family protein [Psychrobacillus sp. INOP01]QUG40564.1 SipW-dependent-type signal peptide-containing protein [Psychrobacillus sp. INOP01]